MEHRQSNNQQRQKNTKHRWVKYVPWNADCRWKLVTGWADVDLKTGKFVDVVLH